MAHDQLQSTTGARLAVRLHDVEQPRAVVCIQHGMAEHSARYDRFQRELAEAGFASVSHDHRGHGLTCAEDASIGYFSPAEGWAKVVQDAGDVAKAAAARHPEAPMVAFGHSMGGIVAMSLALRHGETFAAAAIWNIAFRQGLKGIAFRALLRAERFRKGSDVPSQIARKATFGAFNKRFAPNRTEFDWLNRDENEVDRYLADPHCGHPVTIGMWLDVQDGMALAADDEPLSVLPPAMPFHLLAGGDDPVTDGGAATIRLARRLRALGMEDITSTVLDGTRHEALHELNREQTVSDFIGWLAQRFPAR